MENKLRKKKGGHKGEEGEGVLITKEQAFSKKDSSVLVAITIIITNDVEKGEAYPYFVVLIVGVDTKYEFFYSKKIKNRKRNSKK